MSDSIHERLVRTRNEIAQRGYWKNSKFGPQGQVCIYGGYGIACEQLSVQAPTVQVQAELASALGFEDPCLDPLQSVFNLVHWNDHPATREQDVVDCLDAAIARTAPTPVDPLREVSSNQLENQEQRVDALLA